MTALIKIIYHDSTEKDMIPQKKLKSIIKHSQVTSTSKMHYQPQKGCFVFQIYENKESLLVKTKKKEKLPVLWQLFRTKNHHSANPLLQRSLTHWNWWLEQQWAHQDFLTSHTLSWKMKKFVLQKIASGTNTKKTYFRIITTKIKNLVLPWTVSIPTRY